MASPHNHNYTLNETTVVSEAPKKAAADLGLTDITIPATTAPAPASVEALTDKGPVIRSSRVEQRNAEQQARAAATASSPIPNNAQQQVDAAQIVTPVAKVNDPTATTKPQHLYDWDSVDELTAYNDGKYSPEKLMLDQEKWARENNKPFNILNWFGLSKDKDMSKSKTENEAEEKKRVGQERMEKFANFLKHLGNFVGTVGFGAPSQTLEHPKELTARQQALRDKTEALRSAYNKSYFENYYKQRAEEMNQQKLKLAQRQQDQRDAQQYLNERRFELDEKIKNGTLDLKKLEYELKQKVDEGRLTHQAAQDALGWARNALGWARENRQASGTVTETHKKDKYGNDEVVRVEKKPGNAANNSNTSGNSLGIHVNKGGGNSLGIHVNKK